MFLEKITEIKELMKNCKIEPNKISLWGAAVRDEDAIDIFKTGTLDRNKAQDLIKGLTSCEDMIEIAMD